MNTAAETRWSDAHLDRMRRTCDPLADAAAAHLKRRGPSQMLQQLEELAAAGNADCRRFLEATAQVPAWVDWAEVERGRQACLAFSTLRATGLLGGLLEGYSLSRAAHVLVATGRLHQDVARRLWETSQMNHNMNAPGGLRPGGIAHRHILEVRLLHAMVRRYLRARDWDSAALGEPINQEDMAFTVIEFDYLAGRGMARMGAQLSPADLAAVNHLWRWAGWLHGVDESLLAESPAAAERLYEAIARRQRLVNAESRALVDAVLSGMAGQPPLHLPERALRALARELLGDGLANDYGIGRDLPLQAALAAVKRANRLLTAAHYRLPGTAAAARALHLRLGRRLITQNLGTDPAARAFRGLA